MTGNEVLATAAASRLGLIRSSAWPMVAACLLAAGHDGPEVLALACLNRASSRWQIDPLVPAALRDIEAPDLDIVAAAEIVAPLLAQAAPPTGNYVVLRTLARLAADLDYPGGVLGEAYDLAEWLDCECHRDSAERAEADAFEREIRSRLALDLPPGLAAALINR
jgi:hypothetical protein